MTKLTYTNKSSPKLPVRYQCGDAFYLAEFFGQDMIYILAQVNPREVALVSVDGNRFHDPVHVEDLATGITLSKLNEIANHKLDNFYPIDALEFVFTIKE